MNTKRSNTVENYEPAWLDRWELPDCYYGATWPGYFVFLGQTRDSDVLTRANFIAGLKRIGGEKNTGDLTDADGEEIPEIAVVRESHWAVGWIEWIAIHESQIEALKIADEIKRGMDSYPVIDEDLWSEMESDEAAEIWKNCYSWEERIEYMREHESQFEFHSFAHMLGCARGEYFSGYASELIG